MFKDSHYAAVLGRALISIPFFLSGIGKIAAPAVTHGYIAAAGLSLPWVGYAIAVAVEVGGGLLLLLASKRV
jgi:putative oxidoreductase